MAARRILLYTRQNLRQHAAIMHGVLDHARRHPDWELRLGDETAGGELARVRRWRADGIIAYGWPPARIRRYRQVVRGAVAIVHRDPVAADATVFVDLHRGGRQAADHFLERGFDSFACLSALRGGGVMDRRLRGFRERLAEVGHDCAVFHQEFGAESVWREPQREVVAWIRTLPSRCALFAAGVWIGRDALAACRLAGRHVPEDLAVLCANDDPVLCETIDPPLAAIPMPWQTVGRRAAELLDARLAGRAPRRRLIAIPSPPIVVRRSADILASDHRDLRAALELIAAEACTPLSVATLCRRLGIGRRSLERVFARELGRSPKREIDRVRFATAEGLLRDDSLTIAQVAERCGFDPQVFSRSFAERYGCAPRTWRQRALRSR